MPIEVEDMQVLVGYTRNPYQQAVVQAVVDFGSYKAAADALGITTKAVRRVVERVREAYRDGDVENNTGIAINASSALVDADGNVRMQWIKPDNNIQKQRAMFDAMLEKLPRLKPAAPTHKGAWVNDDELVNVYIITDYHLGMLAWHEETGDDWDLEIGEKMLLEFFRHAIEESPRAERCIFAQLGDFLHFDSFEALTPASKNLLDADTRFAKLVRSAIHVLRQVIEMLRTKYQSVHIIMAEGNHDPASSIWLREMFATMYEDVSDVRVDVEVSPYYYYEMNNTVLFFHHGHKAKMEKLPEVFAAKYPLEFGSAKYRYAHCGHYHHSKVIECGTMVVEQHQTLAAPDAYAARGGWFSQRGAQVITYHSEFGEWGRITVRPEMLMGEDY